MVTMPDDNPFATYGLPGGTYGPCVADGIYLMVAPLSAGQHTIHFAAESFWFGDPWAIDVTYELTVPK